MWLAALWLIAAVVFIAFGAVILFGAPYVPTLDKSHTEIFNLLSLKPGQKFYDLGSGDGRVLIAAAEKGLVVVGYELNPFLVLISRWRLRRFGNRARVHWGSFWKADLSQTDGVFVFLADLHMKRLDRFLKRQSRAFKVVSHAFEIPGRKITKRAGAMLLYTYP